LILFAEAMASPNVLGGETLGGGNGPFQGRLSNFLWTSTETIFSASERELFGSEHTCDEDNSCSACFSSFIEKPAAAASAMNSGVDMLSSSTEASEFVIGCPKFG
jgi:hypothetical protein